VTEFRKEFTPGEGAPLCEVINWYRTKVCGRVLAAGFYWWRNDDLGNLDALHGPFETCPAAEADAKECWETEKEIEL